MIEPLVVDVRIQMKRTEVLLDADTARAWLDTVPPHQPADALPERVQRYAEEMTNGQWRPGSEILFAGGVLCDGHHRLHAAIQCRAPVWVVRVDL